MELGVQRSEIRLRGDWMNAPCPMAFYSHGSGEDKHPSFGMTISDTKRSIFYCFGCSAEPKTLDWLLHNMWLMSKEYPWGAARIFALEENHVDAVQEPKDVWKETSPPIPEPIPPSVLTRFPKLQGNNGYEARRIRRWLSQDRGIPEWVQNAFELRVDSDRQAVLFPLTDLQGYPYVIRVRARKHKSIWTLTPAQAGDEHLTFSQLKDAGVWFGMHLVDWSRPVILVEGEIDCMRLHALGAVNAIASATSSVTEAQLDALTATTLILGYDDDLAGQRAHKRITEYLHAKALLLEVKWGSVTTRNGVACKDPGDLPDKGALEAVLEKIHPIWPMQALAGKKDLDKDRKLCY